MRDHDRGVEIADRAWTASRHADEITGPNDMFETRDDLMGWVLSLEDPARASRDLKAQVDAATKAWAQIMNESAMAQPGIEILPKRAREKLIATHRDMEAALEANMFPMHALAAVIDLTRGVGATP